MRRFPLSAMALLFVSLLAGCAESGGDPTSTQTFGSGAPPLQVDERTGGIRGVVVEPAITPLAGAKVGLNTGQSTVSDKAGLFQFSGLPPGDYLLTVSKPGYTTKQTSTTVRAADAAPPIVKVELVPNPSQRPYVEVHKLNGFYECAFSFGVPGVTPVITDQCDFGVRTVYDEANGTAPYPAPRNVMQGTNTQFLNVLPSVQTIVQEAFWDDPAVPTMMVMLASTPIDNACDCSDVNYMDIVAASPTHARIDRPADGSNITAISGGLDEISVPFPEGRYASRAFLDWNSPSQATNLQFTVITTLFHNYQPPAEWTFATQDQYPVG
ncbi:MAG TPA: carboxypeptidase-like regulatory domain-containing protein [Candidatus Thermoplasmatota archaeon]|nr:carboxypeptidase-like regulatory domain-containing protein [Candidatus Thermoplasmatota archaeon]